MSGLRAWGIGGTAVLVLLWSAAGASGATLLVANKSDHTVDLVDLTTGKSRATLPTGVAPHEAVISPDGKLAVIADYGTRGEPGSTLTIVDVVKAEVARTISLGKHGRPHGLAWLPGGRVAVTTEGSAHLLVVDPQAGRIVQAIATDQQVSHMVAATPDGKRAFVANIGSGTVTAIDLVAGKKIRDIATGAGAEGIAVTPDGREVWVGNRADDTLTVIDARSLEVLATIACPGFPIRVTITPDGKRALVSCARSGEVAAFHVTARKELSRAKLDLTAVEESVQRLFGDQFGQSPVPVGLLVAPDGQRAYVACTQADAVVVLDSRTLRVVDLLKAGREPDGMAYTE